MAESGLRPLNHRHLFYFHRVAEEGGVTAASRLLHISQPALSAQIRKLEEALGEELFDRSGRSLELTEVGKVVNEYAGEIFSLGRAMLDELAGRAGGPRELKVGVSHGFPKLVAHHLLEPATERWPDMSLELTSADPDRLFAQLAVHEVDLLLTDTVAGPVDVRAYHHRLGESPVVVMASPELADRLRPGFPGSLHGGPFLMPSEHSAMRRSLREWLARHRIEPRIVAEINDSAVIKVFGREGVGAFALPVAIEEEVARMYDVTRVGLMDGVREEFFAVSVERRVRNPGVAAVVEGAREGEFLPV